MAASSATVCLTISDLGVAYELEKLHGDAVFQNLKKTLRTLSKKLTNNQDRNMFRSALVNSVTTWLLFEGNLSITVEELLQWQDDLAPVETILVNVDLSEGKQVCHYHAQGKCRFGVSCRNSHN